MTATKNFRVDSSLVTLAIKAPCVVVTTGELILRGEQIVNNVAVVAGDRVLVKNQANTADNGIYEVSTSVWQRTADFDGNNDAFNGTIVSVLGGIDFWATDFWAIGFWTTDFWRDITGSGSMSLYTLSAINPVKIGDSALSFNLLAIP